MESLKVLALAMLRNFPYLTQPSLTPLHTLDFVTAALLNSDMGTAALLCF